MRKNPSALFNENADEAISLLYKLYEVWNFTIKKDGEKSS